MKKRSFSLVEVLIAFSLLSLLMGSLFYFYWKNSLDKKELDKIFALKLEERTCDLHLKKIFSQVKDPLFFSEEKEVIGIFNNGIDEEPLLSQEVLGKLHIDGATHTLCLTLWPHPETKQSLPSKSYRLLPEVKSIEYAFYTLPKSLIVDPQWVGDESPPIGWTESWKKSYQQLPDAIKITVGRERGPITFIYSFTASNKAIPLRENL